MDKLEQKVLDFATKAHEGQVRKYTGEPYITHCIEVANIVKTVKDVTPEMIFSAYFHDVLEDTDTTENNIIEFFKNQIEIYVNPLEIIEIVKSLTNNSELETRAERKEEYKNKLTKSSNKAKTVKLADIISNISTVVKQDRDFALKYVPEKIDLLKVLKEGDDKLYRRACYEVYKAELELGI